MKCNWRCVTWVAVARVASDPVTSGLVFCVVGGVWCASDVNHTHKNTHVGSISSLLPSVLKGRRLFSQRRAAPTLSSLSALIYLTVWCRARAPLCRKFSLLRPTPKVSTHWNATLVRWKRAHASAVIFWMLAGRRMIWMRKVFVIHESVTLSFFGNAKGSPWDHALAAERFLSIISPFIVTAMQFWLCIYRKESFSYLCVHQENCDASPWIPNVFFQFSLSYVKIVKNRYPKNIVDGP